ncbi:MAG: hypothetical protein LUD15_09685 [Bacteroides sp.]|nr:hypothetical protein [Bacteroides sp.]
MIWSWHIWVLDADQTLLREYDPQRLSYRQTALYVGNPELAFDVFYMDRNIGATSTDVDDLYNTFGLYFQHGRKDPFWGPTATFHNGSFLSNRGSEFQVTAPSGDPLHYSIHHPDHFLTAFPATGDWYISDPAIGNSTLWNVETINGIKTEFDPCPEGWRIPGTVEGWLNRNHREGNDKDIYEIYGPMSFPVEVGSDGPAFLCDTYKFAYVETVERNEFWPKFGVYPKNGFINTDGTYREVGESVYHWLKNTQNAHQM